METNMDWILRNIEWIFSGIGVACISSFIWFLTTRNKNNQSLPANHQNSQVVINNNNVSTAPAYQQDTVQSNAESSVSLADRKNKTKIVFIDDDTKFKVAKILIDSGWKNTTIVMDAKTLDESIITDADILFVDIQGVGLTMGFKDEGLGLALALKSKYPNKKIIIYSAETEGNRFHEALRKADSFLPKNADPYEFQKLVEEFSEHSE